MATCKDCIHYGVCCLWSTTDLEEEEAYKYCFENFKPASDVVEVVRCKDCKHSHFIKSCSKYECQKGFGALKFSNDFCSYGEREAQE